MAPIELSKDVIGSRDKSSSCSLKGGWPARPAAAGVRPVSSLHHLLGSAAAESYVGRRAVARAAGPAAPAEAVADESAAAAGGNVAVAAREAPGAPLARAVLAMARGAVGGLDGGGGGGAEEAWAAASGWRPARAADEVRYLVARESLRYVIYA